MSLRVGRMVALSLAVVLAGCGDDSFDPTVDNVAGIYSATTFTVTTVEGTVDVLAEGGSVTLTLDPDGTTTGRLLVPEGGENGEDVDEDLAGTWGLDGNRVGFDQEADTFIGELDFTASEDRLTTEGTFTGETVNLVLTKSD
jgi:hypothetical protein